jgi:hypothetical protein
MELSPGDVTLVRGGPDHYIGHEPGADCLEPEEFRDALGRTPMQYLTDWRMTLARDYLRDGGPGLAKIADVIGYGSPYAFAAAFRRHHGDPPGAWRQRELTRTSSPVADDGIHLR